MKFNCGQCIHAGGRIRINYNMLDDVVEMPRCQNKESKLYSKIIYVWDTCPHFKRIVLEERGK